MSLEDFEDGDPRVVNIYEFYRSHGISDHEAIHLVLHMLLTRTYAAESDAREVASEFQIDIPYVFADNGKLH